MIQNGHNSRRFDDEFTLLMVFFCVGYKDFFLGIGGYKKQFEFVEKWNILYDSKAFVNAYIKSKLYSWT